MIIPAGSGQITIGFTGAGAPEGAAVVFGFANGGAQSALACLQDIAAAWYANILPEQSDQLIMSSFFVKLGPNDTGPTAQSTGTGTGGKGLAPLPPNVSWLVSKQSALGGRRNRGRMYIPGVIETDVDAGGNIGSTPRQNMQDAVDQFLTDLDTAQVPMVILHNTVGAPTVVTSLTVSSRVATQRNRLRR